MGELVNTHNAGFFSCCSVKLHEIIGFFNGHRKEPCSINSKSIFLYYKTDPDDENEDIGRLLFTEPNNEISIIYTHDIDYEHNHQFKHYNTLKFKDINLFVQKYFTITELVHKYISKLENKYNINYDNTVGVFYRGNDKCLETGIASYDEFIDKCKEIQNSNKKIRFLIQTDETEFKETFLKTFSNSFYMEELPTIKKDPSKAIQFVIEPEKRPEFALSFLSSTIIVSKCKYLVTHTGNCGIWACLFRGNANNVYQYIEHPEPLWVSNTL